jgi:hypothetical protein
MAACRLKPTTAFKITEKKAQENYALGLKKS